MIRFPDILRLALVVLAASAAATGGMQAPIGRSDSDSQAQQTQANPPPPPAPPPQAPDESKRSEPRAQESGPVPDESKPKDRNEQKPKDRAAPEDAQGAKWVVVVSKDNPLQSLKVEELRRIFLRQTMHWNVGQPITVYERPTESPICEKFSKEVLKKTSAELKEHWMTLQITQGLKPPKVLRTAALVKEYLQRVQGGVSYLYEHELDDSVKRIQIVDRPGEPK